LGDVGILRGGSAVRAAVDFGRAGFTGQPEIKDSTAVITVITVALSVTRYFTL
jgi:hypothetical protein